MALPEIFTTFARPASWLVAMLMFWTMVLGMPMPSAFSPTVNRTLYFKLPLEGVRFHWEFVDPEDFLAGSLTLRIINDGRDETHVVFLDGKIGDGWAMIGDPRRDSAFYFGFATDERIRTAADDSLILTLTTEKDLRGRGPYSEGILPAGTWRAVGTHGSLYGGVWSPLDQFVLSGDPPVAYLSCWDRMWPLRITRTEGWYGPLSASQEKGGFFRRMRPERGTDGRRCGSQTR